MGAVVRIAGLLHVAVYGGQADLWKVAIAEQTIERAIQIGMFLVPHAKAAYAELGADEVVEKARKILRWIDQKGMDSFTRRDLHQAMRGTFKRANDADQPLDVLAGRGFVRKRAENGNGGPGRPISPTYEVNPRWASQNTQNPKKSARDGNSEYFEDSE